MIPAETPRHLLLASIVALTAGALTFSTLSSHKCPHSAPAPSGYHQVEVGAVTRLGPEYSVRLSDHGRGITMYVGSSEGLAIVLHRDGQRYQRPLSMELMESALFQLGAELVRVQIDSIRDHAYIGSIHLRQGDRMIELDARPSDAVALALAKRAPILVADSVLAEAASDD